MAQTQTQHPLIHQQATRTSARNAVALPISFVDAGSGPSKYYCSRVCFSTHQENKVLSKNNNTDSFHILLHDACC